jgi:hypothetical protein
MQRMFDNENMYLPFFIPSIEYLYFVLYDHIDCCNLSL